MKKDADQKPKHAVVGEYLQGQILNGKLKPGEKIPSEAALAKEFDCSVGTVRRAVQPLVHQGLLERRQGAGTFVRRNQRQKTFGILVPNVRNPDYARLVDVFTAAATAQGYNVLLCVAQHRVREKRITMAREFIERLGRLNITGLLKCMVMPEAESTIQCSLRVLHIPYVTVNDFWTDARGECLVAVDERAEAEMAIEHLVDLGHRQIVLYKSRRDRRPRLVEAFLAALEKRGLPCGGDRILAMRVEEAAEAVCAGGRYAKVSAVVTPYAVYAMDMIKRLGERGLKVPEDLSLMCLNGSPRDEPLRVDLTATIAPVEKMVHRVLDILVNGTDADEVRFLYRPTLHVGITTAPAVRAPGSGQPAVSPA